MGEYAIEHDEAIDAQALLELTEANVSPAADAGAWAAEVAFLREGDEERGTADGVAFGDVAADASLLA
jgi:hypothetical protein